MSEGNMTGRPYGGSNERPDDTDRLPGERPLDDGEVTADPQQSPRAAQEGGMSEGRPFENPAEPGEAPVSDPARP